MEEKKKIKKEVRLKIRRCGCARFRTYEEFRRIKRNQEAMKITNLTIVEDSSLPNRNESVKEEEVHTARKGPQGRRRGSHPEKAWSSPGPSSVMSAEDRALFTVIMMDHNYCRVQETRERHDSEWSNQSDMTIVQAPEVSHFQDCETSPTTEVASTSSRKRRQSKDQKASKLKEAKSPTVPMPDLESAIKFADNVNQLSKLVSILRGGQEETIAHLSQSPVARVEDLQVGETNTGSSSEDLTDILQQSLSAAGISRKTESLKRASSTEFVTSAIEPLPGDVMASEIADMADMGSDAEVQGMVTDILQEMLLQQQQQQDHQPNTSLQDVDNVTSDLSADAEGLMNLDVSEEEKRLLEGAEEGHVLPATNSNSNSVHTESIFNGVEGALTVKHLEDGVIEDSCVEAVTGESSTSKVVVESIAPLSSRADLDDIQLQEADYRLWVSKHLGAGEHRQVAAQADDPSDSEEDSAETQPSGESVLTRTWQLDHQYL